MVLDPTKTIRSVFALVTKETNEVTGNFTNWQAFLRDSRFKTIMLSKQIL